MYVQMFAETVTSVFRFSPKLTSPTIIKCVSVTYTDSLGVTLEATVR